VSGLLGIQDMTWANQRIGMGVSEGDSGRQAADGMPTDQVAPSPSQSDTMRALRLDAMLEMAALTKLPAMVGEKLIDGGRADLAIFDSARLAIKGAVQARQVIVDGLFAKSAMRIEADPIIDGMLAIIGDGESMVDQYDRVMEKMIDYFRKVTDLMNVVAAAVKAEGDKIRVDAKAILAAIEKITGDSGDPAALRNIDTQVRIEPATSENIAKWQKELGSVVRIDGSGKVYIQVDRLQQMYESVKNRPQPWDMDPAAYQAWSSAFSGQKDGIQNDVQTLAEKYAHQKSSFDNLVKVLSGSIATLMDTAKGYLQI